MAESKNRIRELRNLRAWTTEELALRAGTTNATISRLEQGKQSLNVDWLMRLAAALQVRTVDLLEQDDDSVHVVVYAELNALYREDQDIPGRRGGDLIRVPTLHPDLRRPPVVAFSNGVGSWVFAGANPGRHASRFGESVVCEYQWEQFGGTVSQFTLRRYEKSDDGKGGYVMEGGDPARRWIVPSDKRLRQIWNAFAEWKVLTPFPRRDGD